MSQMLPQMRTVLSPSTTSPPIDKHSPNAMSENVSVLAVAEEPAQLNYVSLFSATFVFISWLAWSIINHVLVTLPRWLVKLCQTEFSLTLSLSSLAIYATLILSGSYYFVRQRFLVKYSADTTQSSDVLGGKHRKGLEYVTGSKKKRGTDRSKNYLDEFLSAIKVFGYLERPVFHELTKNMTTQKLVGDEILCLDEGVGFSIVVEGVVQVYTRMDERYDGKVGTDVIDGDFDKDEILLVGNQKYHLLNEVKSGSPLSSLLSTLDLFSTRFTSPFSSSPDFHKSSQPSRPDLVADPLDKAFSSPRFNVTLEDSLPSTPGDFGLGASDVEILPEIIARPRPSSTDEQPSATIAIIPCSAFQRVHSKFPKATSHIVTMVLTRLYKVTLNAVHSYLGLTKDIVDCEVALNAISEQCKLPSYLSETVMESFNNQKDDSTYKNASATMNVMPKSTKKPRKPQRENSSRYVVLASRSKASHPGDLLSSVPLSRRPVLSHTNTLVGDKTHVSDIAPLSLQDSSKSESTPKQDVSYSITHKESYNDIRGRLFSDEREETEESSLRTAIVENIFKLLGIDEESNISKWPGYPSHRISSNSSSSGLSSLMNDSSAHLSMERYFYDSIPEGSRYGSVPSLSVSGIHSSSQKVYPTFHQNSTKANMAQRQPTPPAQSSKFDDKSSGAPDVSFASVKNIFSKNIEVKYFAPGSTLVDQDSFETGLFYVIHGSLDILSKPSDTDNNGQRTSRKLYTVNPGGLAGYLSTIVGFKSLVSIRSSDKEGAIVAYISKEDFSRFMDKFYFLQLPVARKLRTSLPSLIKTIDFALEWCHIPAGGVLASQGDLANGFHVVLSGRFRVVRNNKDLTHSQIEKGVSNLVDSSNIPPSSEKEEDYQILGEYGHGQSIGEVEVLTASRRTNSLIAVRDSETARIPRTLFEMLSLQNPAIMVKVSRIVASRVLESSDRDTLAHAITVAKNSRATETNNEYKTITILPSVNGLPVKEFAENLVSALRAIGRNVIALDRASTLVHLGRHAFDDRLSHLKLSGYFAYLEEKYETIVYVCDTPLKSTWTSTCISQGDCILLLADADDDECATNIGDYERLLLKLKTTARTELCLIHPEKSVMAGSTSIWLKNRVWVHDHHHIRMEMSKDTVAKRSKKRSNILYELALKISSKANPNIKLKLENVTSRAVASLIRLNDRVNKKQHVPEVLKNDFMRLARILSNEAVGLVLGGGGSRGISHVGVVMALEKHGIPVDIIGGTSIGSFVGGLYAKENNIVSIYGMSKKFSSRIGSIWRNIFDLTYPVTSYITGYEFNRGIWKVFGYHEIEDFWIKYFCNSTNITDSKMEIHERGYAWRFIRASMSLAGLLPPIAYNGSMLLDGGYLDNLPVSEMKNRGAKHIIAVDVGSMDDRTPMNYGDTLSGFWVLFNRMNPFSKHPNPPNMMDIQLRLAYVASVYALEIAKKTPGVIYLRPPIDDYATLDFLKFDEIFNVGLAYADEILTKWEAEGKFPTIAGMAKTNTADASGRKPIYRRNSI